MILINLILSSSCLANSNKSLREFFINSKNVYAVYPIDDYTTYVSVDIPGWGIGSGKLSVKFVKEFSNYINNKGWKIFKSENTKDIVTDKYSSRDVPYDLEKEIHSMDVGTDISPFSVPDIMQVDTITFSISQKNWGGGGPSRHVQALLIYHKEKQPWVYRLDPADSIRFDFNKPIYSGNVEKSNIKGLEFGLFDAFKGGSVNRGKGGSGANLYIYLTGYIKNKNCTPKYISSKRIAGVVTFYETHSPYDLFKKMSVFEPWYFGCENVSNPFVAFTKANSKDAHIVQGRTTEGVSYVASSSPLNSDLSSRTTVSRNNNFASQVALKTASSKNTVNLDDQSLTYTGVYNGTDIDGCSLVAVQINIFPEMQAAGKSNNPTEIKNFRICNGRIASSTDTPFEAPADGLNEYLPTVAREAQKMGAATGYFGGFNVRGRSMRSSDKCLVEIKIFKNGNMYDRLTMNGCI